jgi:hypothetical protein
MRDGRCEQQRVKPAVKSQKKRKKEKKIALTIFYLLVDMCGLGARTHSRSVQGNGSGFLAKSPNCKNAGNPGDGCLPSLLPTHEFRSSAECCHAPDLSLHWAERILP